MFLAMLLVQTAVAAVLTETLVFPLATAVAAVFAFARPVRRRLSVRQTVYGALALALLFAAKSRLFPLAAPGRFSVLAGHYAASYATAQWLLWVQVVLLGTNRFASRPEPSRFPVRYAIPFLAALQLAFTMNFITRAPVFRWTALVGACLFAALFGAVALTAPSSMPTQRRSRGRWVASAVVLALALGAGVFVSRQVASNAVNIDMFFLHLFQPRTSRLRSGLSERTTLRSVSAQRDTDADRVAVRVESDRAPGYLRAHAREHLDGQVWGSRSRPVVRTALETPDGPMRAQAGDAPVYAVRAGRGPTAAFLRVWSATQANDRLLTTLDTRMIATSAARFLMDEHQSCRAESLPRSRPYLLATGAEPGAERPDDVLLERCLEIPASLTEAARAVCVSVLAGARNTEEKIGAVVDFFESNYAYALGIAIPRGQDPLSYFLTERPDAHCEYFASAAAVMLRLADVPARYVVGYVVAEKNEAGGYWVARNRDAHAWVEAWDEDRGWITVEATPADGLPQPQNQNAFADWLDRARFQLAVAWAALREQGLVALGAALARMARGLIGTWPGRVFLMAFLGLIGAKAVRFLRARTRTLPVAADEAAFQRLLARMDGRARRIGFVRGPNETLLAFAKRLDAADNAEVWPVAAAGWYRACAAWRCDGTTLSDALPRIEKNFAAAERCEGNPMLPGRNDQRQK